MSVIKLGTSGNVFPSPSVLLGITAPRCERKLGYLEEVEELNYGI